VPDVERNAYDKVTGNTVGRENEDTKGLPKQKV
jgi:hypothetical protein